MANFLTRDDVANYGPELVDFAQRAAAHAVGPELQALNQQNAELARQVAIERRKRLDDEVAAAVPNYQQIDQDPRWHQYLLGIHELSGRVRQEWLNDAIAHGDAGRVISFFRGFLNQYAVAGGRVPGRTEQAAFDPNKYYTRDQIKAAYEQKRKGRYVGREDEWNRIEEEIVRAGGEGRVIGAEDPAGR